MCAKCKQERKDFFHAMNSVTLYRQGMTVPQLAEFLKRDPLTVAYWIEEYA